MADEEAEIARWRGVAPALFDECDGRGISEYAVLNALQLIERGQLGSIEEARLQLLRQHEEKAAIREKMRLAMAQRAVASAATVQSRGMHISAADMAMVPMVVEQTARGERA